MIFFKSFSLLSCLLITLSAGFSPHQISKLQTATENQPDSKLQEKLNANQQDEATAPEFIKLGLLIPTKGIRANEGLAVRRGAELAIAQANNNGGFDGRPFKLAIRSNNGLWGSGSKEIVKLVFEENVWAILGALDGRSAHLAEQIITKGQVVLVSPWATDPTLTQINIPWFFRCVADDRQQAKVLAREIFQARKLKHIATVAAETYDARMAAATFARSAVAAGYSDPLQIFYGSGEHDFQTVVSQIKDARIEGIVLFGRPGPTAKLVKQMRANGIEQALFAPLSLANDDFLSLAGADLEGAVLIAPGHWNRSEGKNFQREFENIYACRPSTLSAYAYDGMRLIIEAIKSGGLDREKIRDALAGIEYPPGVTGPIRFDASGNRLGDINLIEIIEGHARFYR